MQRSGGEREKKTTQGQTPIEDSCTVPDGEDGRTDGRTEKMDLQALQKHQGSANPRTLAANDNTSPTKYGGEPRRIESEPFRLLSHGSLTQGSNVDYEKTGGGKRIWPRRLFFPSYPICNMERAQKKKRKRKKKKLTWLKPGPQCKKKIRRTKPSRTCGGGGVLELEGAGKVVPNGPINSLRA